MRLHYFLPLKLFFITFCSWIVLTHNLKAECILVSAQERELLSTFHYKPPHVNENNDLYILGKTLFFERRLSANQNIACADCHIPETKWTTNSPPIPMKRAVPSLLDVANSTWFNWDGKADSLWSQAALPLLSSEEMNATQSSVVSLILGDEKLRALFFEAFPRNNTKFATSTEYETQIFVNALKAIAVFEKTVFSAPSRFDKFVSRVVARDEKCNSELSSREFQGFRLFAGKARCVLCHNGPVFSDDAFHDIGVPDSNGLPSLDPGRYVVIENLLQSKFNQKGIYSDLASSDMRVRRLDFLFAGRELWGAFRTPRLRNVEATAPYMHNNALKTLSDVIEFYNNGGGRRGEGHHGETVLRPLNLSNDEVQLLEQFLTTLTSDDQNSLKSNASSME